MSQCFKTIQTYSKDNLPPNVIGKANGFLELEITLINLKFLRTSTILNHNYQEPKKLTINNKNKYLNNCNKIDSNIFNDILLKFIWWGESNNQSKVINVNKLLNDSTHCLDKNLNSNNNIKLKYNINTTRELFFNYLKNCDPIQIKFLTKTSNLLIGISVVRIPRSFLNIKTASDIVLNDKQKSDIINKTNQKIGELIINFKMLFYETQMHETVSKPSNFSDESSADMIAQTDSAKSKKSHNFDTKRSDSKFESKTELTDIHDELREILNTERSNYKAQKIDAKRKSKKNNENSEILSCRLKDYLSGKPMSNSEEIQALREIHNVSPLSNVVDTATTISSVKSNSSQNILPAKGFNYNYPNEPICKRNYVDNRMNVLQFNSHGSKKLNRIRLDIKYIKLLPSGIREVYVETLASTTFTIECRIVPNFGFYTTGDKTGRDFDLIRFYSDSYDDIEQRIDFHKYATRKLKLIYNEYDQIEHSELILTIWWREFGSKQSRCLGTTKYRFTNQIICGELQLNKTLPIKSCAGGVHVADLYCHVTLDRTEVNLVAESTEIIETSESARNCLTRRSTSKIFHNRNFLTHCCNNVRMIPNSYDDNQNNSTNNKQCNSGAEETTSKNFQRSNDNLNRIDNKSSNDPEIKTDSNENEEEFSFLHGLLRIDGIKNVQILGKNPYFIVTRAFWKEDASSSESFEDNKLDFIETFNVIANSSFLERTRKNHMIIELWEKTKDKFEKLIGIVRIPLHQFYIAFRDLALSIHLAKSKLPVISIDGWVPIVSPLNNLNCGQIQVLLALGTAEQLEYLKVSRGFVLSSKENHSSTDILIKDLMAKNYCNFGTQTTDNDEEENVKTVDSTTNTETQSKLSTVLGNFLENLSKQMSDTKQQQQQQQQTSTNIVSQKRTSELLDVLTKALKAPVKTPESPQSDIVAMPEIKIPEIPSPKFCKILLEIESALHLPKIQTKLVANKKFGKKSQKHNLLPNEEPSSYVTFQAEEGNGQMFKSHEGLVYATNVAEKSSNPSWGKRFEILVPVDLLINDEKRFILKVWRKVSNGQSSQTNSEPTPMNDSIIGFASIDLNVLTAGMSCISGYFNIVDFSGRINGQIKVKVESMEDLTKFKPTRKFPANTKTTLSNFNTKNIIETLNSEENSNHTNETGDIDINNTTLSRAIKRKFTELEEITQRLRARLLDVTGEAETVNDFNDVDDEQLDEFERDLNTTCLDDDDDANSQINWLQNLNTNKDQQPEPCSSKDVFDLNKHSDTKTYRKLD